jgi:ferredoxin-thioredoxin reductase catalytic subunit
MSDDTPQGDRSLDALIDRARRMALRYAEVGPYRLNPDEQVWMGIVRGIGRQAHTFGWSYCP